MFRSIRKRLFSSRNRWIASCAGDKRPLPGKAIRSFSSSSRFQPSEHIRVEPLMPSGLGNSVTMLSHEPYSLSFECRCIRSTLLCPHRTPPWPIVSLFSRCPSLLDHNTAGPRPVEGTCEPLVIPGPTGIEMVNEMLLEVRIKSVEALIRKGAQQQFRLVEPTGMWRRIERPQQGICSEVGARLMGNMPGSVVRGQVQSLRPRIAPSQLSERLQEMFVVVSFQIPPHIMPA
jgi:hypothetical protein